MKKKVFGAIAVVVLVAVIAAGLLIVRHSPVRPHCLASSPGVGPSGAELNDLEIAALGANMTVPAGTNADVRIATYDGSHATGSVIFPGKYGTYNFLTTRDNSVKPASNYLNWRLTSSSLCKQ